MGSGAWIGAENGMSSEMGWDAMGRYRAGRRETRERPTQKDISVWAQSSIGKRCGYV